MNAPHIAESLPDRQPLDRVLIIEDQPVNTLLLQKALSQDYVVLCAKSGEDGLAMAVKSLPDLILLDIMMPGIDGYEVCRRLKEGSLTADIPVIYLTGLDSTSDELRGLETGAVDYITKPFNVSIVRARVKSQIELRKYQRLKAQLANLDGLTGLANRAYFEAQLGQEWKRARRTERPLSLVLADIDQFNAYVTRHGRMAGDECLKAVAQKVAQVQQRPADLAARMAGDVFMLLLPETEAEGGRLLAETLRRDVESLRLSHPDATLGHVTLSCSVVTVVPGSDDLSRTLIDRADGLINAAKARGRNCVVSSEDGLEPPVPATELPASIDSEAVIQSIVSFTEQQDLQSLDQGLLIALQEMLQPVFIMILELSGENDMHPVVTQGAKSIPLPAELTSELARLDDMHPHLTVVGDFQYLYCGMDVTQGQGRHILLLGKSCHLNSQLGTFKGMVRVYQNFIRLMREGQRDTLTGLQNRRTLEAELSSLLASFINGRRSSDRNKGAALAVLDLDKFKRINDTYGHLIGDEVLLIFSQILQSSLRGPDRPFRYGGEEFIVILNDVDEPEAAKALERIRQNVERRDFPQVGRVTVSIGYTIIESQLLPAQIIEEADKALYYAKEHGRNQVRAYSALPSELITSTTATSGDVELF